ncbi:putative glycerophosphoryl diester phosphodiesterase protein [Aspergillus mulundensis]|uniref:Putative glycerophosphoryl diester phosphodiesterase protein n=1 Tax=Aspergillus mulundensis TaxID=1810919 RepID=A0A3D8R9T1_9EURO|nr:putative glycerophosphoryl diester phosphodiesterase protein [Aspergillus mulundensis]RDW70668.1 putative glycerophosphoryl diester phosphodiesterase protein [Aspergillus mulundensis]
MQRQSSPKPDGIPATFPQAIAHRGYSALFPENSMAAFRAAVEVGAHAIETDLHLSRDGVIVLSHDSTLKRCFGDPRKVAECEWEALSTLRTLRGPVQPMARLLDLLEYLAGPGVEEIWILLDIKKTDDPRIMCAQLAKTIARVPSERPWDERIILGAWQAEWVAACHLHLPGFPVALTTAFPAYASAMLAVPGLHFSVLNYALATQRGSRLRARARAQGRRIFSWPDNADEWMARSIRCQADGVITDDPGRFLALCEQWQQDAVRRKAGRSTPREAVLWVGVNLLVWVLELVEFLREGSPRERVRRVLGSIHSDGEGISS